MNGGEGFTEVGVGGGFSVEMGESLTRRGGFANSLTFLLQDLIVSLVLKGNWLKVQNYLACNIYEALVICSPCCIWHIAATSLY